MIRHVDITILPDGRLRVRDAAAYLGISEKTLAMWRCQGAGPRFVKAGRIFYFRDDLDSWLAQGAGRHVTTGARRKTGHTAPAHAPEITLHG